MALFFGLTRISSLGPDYKGRLARFAGDGDKGSDAEEKKKPKLTFNLGLGETEVAAKMEKAFGEQTYGRKIQRKLAQADLKLTLLEYMLGKGFMLAIGVMVGLYLGRGGAVQQVIFAFAGIVVGWF